MQESIKDQYPISKKQETRSKKQESIKDQYPISKKQYAICNIQFLGVFNIVLSADGGADSADDYQCTEGDDDTNHSVGDDGLALFGFLFITSGSYVDKTAINEHSDRDNADQIESVFDNVGDEIGDVLAGDDAFEKIDTVGKL